MTDDHAAPTRAPAIALIGFGEAGSAFLKGWRQDRPDLAVRAYDIKTESPDLAICDAKLRDYANAGATGCAALADALAGAEAVFSLVTADQAFAAADAAAPHIPAGALFFDCNSCSPGAKRRAAARIEAAGARYVDAAVMSPVHPRLHRSPILLSGPHAGAAAAFTAGLDMDAKPIAGEVGAASSVKMVRSVMMKGLEALVLECVLAARRAGVDGMVLDSLDVTYPGFDWKRRAAYMLERSLTHGRRRAAEMREVAATVAELGLSDAMSQATVGWQQTAGDLGLDASAIGADDYRRLADAILSALADDDAGPARAHG